jgi:CO/xanthine dehydrogenase Mo-binding subunit
MSVGQSPRRLDGIDKATGAARYVDDLALPGMWHGVAVRSRNAHARYRGFEKDPDFDWSDIVVASAADIPGPNLVALIVDDQPALVEHEIRHPEEPVILLAAPTRERALQARKHLKLLEDPLPAVFDPEESRRGAGPVWGRDNVQHRLQIEKGWGRGCVDRALAERPEARLFLGEYRTGWQEQLYIEPQGMIAQAREDGGISVWGSLQCPYYVVKALSSAFLLPKEKVRVVQCTTGGGFGGKEDYPSVLAIHAALLARNCGRPVKMIYERSEDVAVTTRRHPSIVRHRSAVLPDGSLLASEVDVLLDGGAYTTLSPVVLSRALIHAIGPYRCEHAWAHGDVVATHTAPNGAFRGFGAPQVCFASERHLDRIARGLGRDPLDLRRQLALRPGDTTLTGQVLRESVASEEVLEKAIQIADFHARRREAEAVNRRGGAPSRRAVPGLGTSPRLRGVGLSFFFHGAGFTGNGEAKIQGSVRVELGRDGVVTLFSGSTDIGQGTRTIFPQIAAETLGLPMDFARLWEPDTQRVPDSGPTVASRTCMVVGKVVQDCCAELRRRVLGEAAGMAGRAGASGAVDADRWRAAAEAFLGGGGDGTVERKYEVDESLRWNGDRYEGDAYPCYAWACDIVEVEVEPDTMEVAITGLWTAQDVGKAIHPVLVSGQIEGGTLQALGWATVEEMLFKEGRPLNTRMTNYIVPTALDAPEMQVVVVENPFSGGPFGAKGVGELPMDGGAPAVLAAIEHATGISLDSLPASPEALLRAARARREAAA